MWRLDGEGAGAGGDASILIVKLGSIGDIVHTLPAVAALRRRFPEGRIDWLVEARSKEILVDNPLLDDILEVDTLRWRRRLYLPGTWRDIRRSVGALRSRRYDLVFDFQGLVKSGVCAWLARSRRRVGFGRAGLRESLSAVFTNHHVTPPPGQRHVIDKNLSLLEVLGIEGQGWTFPIGVAEDMKRRAEQWLRSAEVGEFVAVNPGGGWATKKWSPKRYGQVAQELERKWKLPSLVFWGPDEDSSARAVVEASKGAARLAPATSLRGLIPYLQRARLFIGGDTGPFHMASALGVPVVGLFGPSDPVVNGPFSGEDRVIWKHVPCSPCYKRRCPGFGTVCLTSIEVAEVLEAVELRLGLER